MILLGISESLDPDLTQHYSSTSIGGGALNGAGYKNPEMDDLLDEACRRWTGTSARTSTRRSRSILMQDLPTPLVTYPRACGGQQAGQELRRGGLDTSTGHGPGSRTSMSPTVSRRRRPSRCPDRVLLRFLLRRSLAAIPVVVGVTLITFLLMHSAAGSYVPGLSLNPNLTPKDVEQLRSELGLDQPIYVQYLDWIGVAWVMQKFGLAGVLVGAHDITPGLLQGSFGQLDGRRYGGGGPDLRAAA